MAIKYIFSINAGRCGSDYLTELFAKAKNTVSVHEGFPIMNGEPMAKFNNGNEKDLKSIMQLKMAQIEKRCRKKDEIYCETNHSYIKGWGYLIPDEFIAQEEIGVVILKRDPDKMIESFLRIRGVPGVSAWSRTWFLSPGARRNLSQPKNDANYEELCEWQIEEIDLRAREYRSRFPKITYVECDLEELNSFEYVIQVFNTFGLIASPDLNSVVGKPVNVKNEWPKLSREKLVSTSPYPNADMLPLKERDILIQEMVTYLLRRERRGILSEKCDDHSTKNSLIFTARKIVAHTEEKLESVFGYCLKFTDTEMILIFELLHSIAPLDVAFFYIKRSPPPGLSFSYDFNRFPRLPERIRKLGFKGAVKLALGSVLPRAQDHDFSHRNA